MKLWSLSMLDEYPIQLDEILILKSRLHYVIYEFFYLVIFFFIKVYFSHFLKYTITLCILNYRDNLGNRMIND